jgi:hypothetical protein
MGGVLMAIAAGVIVSRIRLDGAILVMPECHALTRYDRRHALDRDGQSQQKDRQESEERFRHRQALYRQLL